MPANLFLSKSLGTAIILAAGLMRIPQIIRISLAKSSDGIAPMMFYLESMVMLNICGFARAHDLPFTLYGDNLLLTLQNVIIIAQMWFYNKQISFKHKAVWAIFGTFYSSLILGGAFSLRQF